MIPSSILSHVWRKHEWDFQEVGFETVLCSTGLWKQIDSHNNPTSRTASTSIAILFMHSCPADEFDCGGTYFEVLNWHAFLSTLGTKEKFSFAHSLHHEHRACVARKPDEKTPQELHCNKILHNAPLCKNILLPFLSSELVGTLDYIYRSENPLSDNKENNKHRHTVLSLLYVIIRLLKYDQTLEIRSWNHSQVDRKISWSHKIQILRLLL